MWATNLPPSMTVQVTLKTISGTAVASFPTMTSAVGGSLAWAPVRETQQSMKQITRPSLTHADVLLRFLLISSITLFLRS